LGQVNYTQAAVRVRSKRVGIKKIKGDGWSHTAGQKTALSHAETARPTVLKKLGEKVARNGALRACFPVESLS
jgi:hypothetical protein